VTTFIKDECYLMKIIYLHQYFITPDQAGGTRSYEMAKRFVQWGHEVHIVTTWTKKTHRTDWFTENIDGINVHWLPLEYSNKMGFTERLKAFFAFAFHAAKRAAKLRGDVVFATSTPLTIALPGIYASIRTGCPMVFEVRDLWPHVPIAMGVLKNPIIVGLAKLLEKIAYRKSTHVVALSQGMADGVASTGFPVNQISVISNSSDISLFNSELVSSGVFRKKHPELPLGPFVLYPGTLGRVNGVGYIAELAAEVLTLRKDISFVVIGDGIEKDSFSDLAKNNGTLNKNLFIYPPVPKKELIYAFRDASMIISTVIDLPALEANSANKIFDAMAAGKALAINHGGWQKDLIEKNDIGLALPRDISKAARMLVDFFNDEARVIRSNQNSYQMAVNEYSRDLLAKKLEGVLLAAVSKTT